MAQLVKNLPAMWETWVRSLGWEDPLEKGKGYQLQYFGLENSMDSPWGRKGSDMAEQLSLSMSPLIQEAESELKPRSFIFRCPHFSLLLDFSLFEG